jgi:feruloyl esterase
MSRHLVLVLSLVLLATVALAPAPAAAHFHPIACADLPFAPIPNTTITTAQTIPAGTILIPSPFGPPQPASVPNHCYLEGKISERVSSVDGKPYALGFAMRLPVDWNGRFFFQGGGGTDGNIGSALGNLGNGQTDSAILRGYAVVSTDGGHTAEPVPGIGGVLFGIDPQARIDFGYNALDKVTRIAKLIIKLHYGERPRYSYFIGCSNGGRQGMVASQRFPEHFDGIVAGDPGFNLPKAGVAEAWDSQAFASIATLVDVNGQPYLPTTFSFGDLALVANAVLNKCDALDGLGDGIIDNLPACHFDPSTLQCPGAKDATCLSPEQVTVLETVFNGARNSEGRRLYSNWPYDAGVGDPGWRIWKIGFPSAPPFINNAINLTLGAGAVPYVFMTPPDTPAGNQLVQYMLEFDFDLDAPRIFQTSGIYNQSSMEFMSANSTDLREFRKHRNKLIIYHGASDPVFSVNDTIRWYRRLRWKTHGTADHFARLFVIPGMTHCSGGPATDAFDALTPIVNWVENGEAPDQIAATARNTTPWPGRTRPLCPYPEQTRYNGSGDINNAANFSCAKPHHHHDHDFDRHHFDFDHHDDD